MSAADEVVVATWSEHSEIGHHYEDLLADGQVIAWTEPPFGETLYPGDDDRLQPDLRVPDAVAAPVLHGVRRLRRLRAVHRPAHLAPADM
ncbi:MULTISPECIES: hypothetical protein [Streptomyces]|uniref:hypothetical protein n=1 Tax=Streptomyces TaxID=1883 RepID=UPI0016738D90|nr:MULTISPECIES: hypothetical protein [Streptomyces]MBD3580519.1 hypothetical protein [Streptomyces sp. KD18]GGT30383.1 hypothetical protein GCM10010286_64420 [Streptomyces toxytricini]